MREFYLKRAEVLRAVSEWYKDPDWEQQAICNERLAEMIATMEAIQCTLQKRFLPEARRKNRSHSGCISSQGRKYHG